MATDTSPIPVTVMADDKWGYFGDGCTYEFVWSTLESLTRIKDLEYHKIGMRCSRTGIQKSLDWENVSSYVL
jgi:hypothetical protein